MTYRPLVTLLVVGSTLALAAWPAGAEEQRRRDPRVVGRAVRRPVAPPVVHVRPRVVRPHVVRVVPHRVYAPRYGASLYFRYPGYTRYGYPYGYGGGYGDGYTPGYYAFAPGQQYGGVRIDLPQREAQVYVGGYYVGAVDEFDGVFQQLNLEPGPHRIEIRADGYEPIAFDVRVQPGRTITYRASMRPLYP